MYCNTADLQFHKLLNLEIKDGHKCKTTMYPKHTALTNL